MGVMIEAKSDNASRKCQQHWRSRGQVAQGRGGKYPAATLAGRLEPQIIHGGWGRCQQYRTELRGMSEHNLGTSVGRIKEGEVGESSRPKHEFPSTVRRVSNSLLHGGEFRDVQQWLRKICFPTDPGPRYEWWTGNDPCLRGSTLTLGSLLPWPNLPNHTPCQPSKTRDWSFGLGGLLQVYLLPQLLPCLSSGVASLEDEPQLCWSRKHPGKLALLLQG